MERSKDEAPAENAESATRPKWFWVKVLVTVLCIIFGGGLMLIATAVRFSGMN